MQQIVPAHSPSSGGSKIVPPPAAATPTAPILLYDTVTIPSGGETPFKSSSFTNNRGRRICLYELRCSVQIPPVLSNKISAPALIALSLVVKRKSGKTIPITRGYIPLYSIVRSDNRTAEIFSLGATGAPIFFGAEAWRFADPLDLNPGDMIVAQGKHLGLVNAPATINLTFAGADAVTPVSTRVPYIVSWQSRDFAYAENGTDSAPPDTLVNDVGRELTVDRIIGRFLTRNPNGAANDAVLDFQDQSDQAANSAFVRLGMAQSRPILRTFAPFRAVFGENAAFECGFTLAPNDFLTVDVQHTAGPTLATPLTYFVGRALISMIGRREAP